MRIMVTGGGTGGHTSPALAVIQELQKRDTHLSVQWVGGRKGIEARICKQHSIPFRALPVSGWPRNRGPRQVWVACTMAIAWAKSVFLLYQFKPQVVFGVGAYASLPLMHAAQRMGYTTVIHEQNRVLGMANRILAPRATRLFLSYPDTQQDYPEGEFVGNVVRPEFVHPPRQEEARKKLGLDSNIPVVLVVGGSQGARSINLAMEKALRTIKQDEIQVVWMTGHEYAPEARQIVEETQTHVQVFPFIEDMVSAMAAADLVIARAGASTSVELATIGKPSILVPYPGADNHQEHNARAFEAAQAAVTLLNPDCTGDALLELIRSLLSDPTRLESMATAARTQARPGAAERIVDELLKLVFENNPD